MSRRVYLTFTDEEFKALKDDYMQFIQDYDWENEAIPTFTGYVAAVVIASLKLRERIHEASAGGES